MKIVRVILLCLGCLSVISYAGERPAMPKGARLFSYINQGNYAFKLSQFYVVHITARNFKGLGEHYGRLLKAPIQHQLQMESVGAQLKPAGMLTRALLLFYKSGNKVTPHERQFIQGESESAGLSFDDLLYMNLSFMFSVTDRPKFTIPTMCTFIAKRTARETLVGRNLEWTTQFHGQNGQGPIVVTVFHLKDGLPHHVMATVGYLGWYDAATAINDQGLFAEVNSGEGSNNSMSVFGTPNLTTDFVDFMLDDGGLSQLKRDVMATKTSLAYIANVAGPALQPSQPFIYSIEKAITPMPSHQGGGFATTSLARIRTTPTYYKLPVSPDLLVATNTFRVRGWDHYLQGAYPSLTPFPSLADDKGRKSFHRYNNVDRLATQAATWSTKPDQTMQRIIAAPLQKDGNGGSAFVGKDPTDTLYTYYSVVFNTQSKVLYINDLMAGTGWVRLGKRALGLG